MKLNEFDRIVCLCVPGRFETEYPRLQKLFAERGAETTFYLDNHLRVPPAGWPHGRGAYSQFMAVQEIFRQARADGVKNLLYVEDDCDFLPNFDEVLDKACQQIDVQGVQWDMLYYGANHTWAPTSAISENLLKLRGSLTMHLTAFRDTVFDDIIGLRPTHIVDKVIADTLHHQCECYAIWPSIAVQKPGFSYLNNCPVDYLHYFRCKGSNQ